MEKRRILIVDNNDELHVLEQALGSLGHEIVVIAKREKHSVATTSTASI